MEELATSDLMTMYQSVKELDQLGGMEPNSFSIRVQILVHLMALLKSMQNLMGVQSILTVEAITLHLKEGRQAQLQEISQLQEVGQTISPFQALVPPTQFQIIFQLRVMEGIIFLL